MECKKILGLSTVGNVIVIQLGKDTYWVTEKAQLNRTARNFSGIKWPFLVCLK